MRDLFARSFRYEDRATDSIQKAKERWANVEEILEALEWGMAHDPAIGRLLNEKGLRGFVYPGARSMNEPDIDVIYEDANPLLIIHDLVFRDAKAHHAGHA
ncbi:MAG TPA: hypothetical protein VFB16_15755 [Bauldia sp.]|nr:hypothetical protein [Bauldia sp.]